MALRDLTYHVDSRINRHCVKVLRAMRPGVAYTLADLRNATRLHGYDLSFALLCLTMRGEVLRDNYAHTFTRV